MLAAWAAEQQQPDEAAAEPVALPQQPRPAAARAAGVVRRPVLRAAPGVQRLAVAVGATG
jgi:hypothetical protein